MSDKPPIIIDYAMPGRKVPPTVVDYASAELKPPKPPNPIRSPGPVFGVLLVILLAAICLIGVVLLFAVG
jgi:hypothetical protein